MSTDPRPGDAAPDGIICEKCHSDRVVVGTVVAEFIYYRCETCFDVWSHLRRVDCRYVSSTRPVRN